MEENTRRSTTTGTIPNNTALSGGTVTTDATIAYRIVYTGTDNLTDAFLRNGDGLITGANPTYLNPSLMGVSGNMWLYVATATIKLAKILSVTKIDATHVSILIDRNMSGLSGANAAFLLGNLKEYSVANDGGSDGIFDYTAIVSGTTIHPPVFSKINEYQDAKMFDATGTSFLITENK